MITNDVGVEPINQIERYDKETKRNIMVNCPNVIRSYNSHMGGIDKNDMLILLYKTPMKSKRWYLRIFAYCLDLAVVNGWLLYKRDAKALQQRPMNLKTFRLKIYTGFLNNCPRSTRLSLTREIEGPSSSRGQRAPLPHQSKRYDTSVFHCPKTIKSRQTCKVCSHKGNIVTRSNVICMACNVHLCMNLTRNCFYMFHTSK